MKKLIFWVWAFLSASSGTFAQQIPLYSQYFENPFIINPAYAGLDKFGSFNLTQRNQWTDIPGAPVTTLMTIDVPFYEMRSGIGINIHRDKIGIFENYKASFAYAYHIIGRYVDSSVLSFGFSGSYQNTRTNFDNMFILHPNDPKLLNNTGNFSGTEVSFGINYMFKDKFQIGFTMPQAITTGIRAVDNNENSIGLKEHYLLSLKCTLKTYDDLHYVEPMALIRYVRNTPMQIDVGIQYTYNQLFWVNAAYRMDYAAVMSFGLKLRSLRVAIATDFPISDIQSAAGSTVELMIGYKFGHIEEYKYPHPPKRNSSLRYKRYHPSIPGPLPRQFYMKNTAKYAKKFKKKRK